MKTLLILLILLFPLTTNGQNTNTLLLQSRQAITELIMKDSLNQVRFDLYITNQSQLLDLHKLQLNHLNEKLNYQHQLTDKQKINLRLQDEKIKRKNKVIVIISTVAVISTIFHFL